jgi:DNA-binding NtrC family response regulator
MGKVALVVEDELFIVLELEDLLRSVGFNIVVSRSSVTDALMWLGTERADLAIVDYRLRDTTSEALVDRLIEKATPTVIYSGNEYSEDVHNQAMKHFEWVSKPASPEVLGDAIKRAKV